MLAGQCLELTAHNSWFIRSALLEFCILLVKYITTYYVPKLIIIFLTNVPQQNGQPSMEVRLRFLSLKALVSLLGHLRQIFPSINLFHYSLLHKQNPLKYIQYHTYIKVSLSLEPATSLGCSKQIDRYKPNIKMYI